MVTFVFGVEVVLVAVVVVLLACEVELVAVGVVVLGVVVVVDEIVVTVVPLVTMVVGATLTWVEEVILVPISLTGATFQMKVWRNLPLPLA